MFAKVFRSLWTGSLAGQRDPQHVFLYLLAHSDREGFVDVHPTVIAALTGVPLADVKAALLVLEAPDPASRTPDEEGRRILRQDAHREWGWKIVNRAKYQSILNDDQRREDARTRMRTKRENDKRSQLFADVRTSSPPFPQVEVDTEKEDSTPSAPSDSRSTPVAAVFTLVGTNGTLAVSEADLAQWAETYPKCGGRDGVLAELLRMADWMDSNPTRRKTSRGLRRFATAWMGRVQDSARPGSHGMPGSPTGAPLAPQDDAKARRVAAAESRASSVWLDREDWSWSRAQFDHQWRRALDVYPGEPPEEVVEQVAHRMRCDTEGAKPRLVAT